MLVPLFAMATSKTLRFNDELRKLIYFIAAILIQMGIFATRWNIVVGGQALLQELPRLTAYKMEITGLEGCWSRWSS